MLSPPVAWVEVTDTTANDIMVVVCCTLMEVDERVAGISIRTVFGGVKAV